LKKLGRQGFATQHRAGIWKHLVYAKVADIRADKGDHYYKHLVMRSRDSAVSRCHRCHGVNNFFTYITVPTSALPINFL